MDRLRVSFIYFVLVLETNHYTVSVGDRKHPAVLLNFLAVVSYVVRHLGTCVLFCILMLTVRLKTLHGE